MQVLLMPGLSALLLVSLGRCFGTVYGGLLSTYSALSAAILSLLCLYSCLRHPSSMSIDFGLWFAVDAFDVNWLFFIDSITCTMMLVITSISFLVHLYSIAYLDDDPSLIRFLAYLSLFTFFMLFYVMAGNYILMFIGWEGVGLVSYLLINFWYNRFYANRAALKAIIVNRVGDFFFISAIVVIWAAYGNTDITYLINSIFQEQNIIIDYLGISIDLNFVISLFLLLAALVKSAQIGFHTWLADAMEGPTPVSALLHAATMVTAGVYLIIRSSFFIDKTPAIATLMLLFGAVTTFFASFTAFFQYDLKKIIAYSTCAQLGLMFVSCGLGNYILALFHLFNHAFFKALLFLSAGIIIHGAHDEQDIRKFGNMWYKFPIIFYAFFIGSLSLMGMPFLTGFYSKELILNMLLISTRSLSFVALWLALLGTMFTAAYSTRLMDFVFFKQNFKSTKVIKTLHESTRPELLTPIVILTIASIVVGYAFQPIFLAPNSTFWKNSMLEYHVTIDMLITEQLPFFLKLLPFFITILGIGFHFFYQKYFLQAFIKKFLPYYIKMNIKDLPLNSDLRFLQAKQRAFFFDHIYYFYGVVPLLTINYNIIYKVLEKGLFELFGPTGLSRVLSFWNKEIILDNQDDDYETLFIIEFGAILLLVVLELLFL